MFPLPPTMIVHILKNFTFSHMEEKHPFVKFNVSRIGDFKTLMEIDAVNEKNEKYLSILKFTV